MAVSAADVKKLRDATGAGMMDCKNALESAGGDFDAARKALREKGLADAQKRKGRTASEGVVATYLHAPQPGIPPKIGVMVELNCETDFVAKMDEFQEMARDIAMHVAAAKPLYLNEEDIPEKELQMERDLAAKKVEGKPENVVEKATEGAIKKFKQQVVLMDQKFTRDDSVTVRELIDAFSGKIGENIGIRQFARFAVGEASE